MKLSEKIQIKLRNGHWVFDDLAGAYKVQLEKRVNPYNLDKNISELCIANYKNIDLFRSELVSNSKGLYDSKLDASVSGVVQDIFSQEFPESSVINFESTDSDKITMAFEFIRSHNADSFNLAGKNITSFLRLRGTSFRTASHPHLYGVIIIGDGFKMLSVEDAAVSILHELAHQELFLINLVDRLVNQPFELNEIHAPMQGKKRPPIGRLHSLWALYRMVEFQLCLGNKNSKHYQLLVQNIKAFEEGELTDFGKALVEVAKTRAA